MKNSRILIAVDSGEYNIKVAREGFLLAEKMNAQPALIFVVDSSKAMGNVDAGISSESALIVLKKEAEFMISGLSKMYHGPHELVKWMPVGRPTEEIILTAKDWHADMIVIGKQGKSGWIRLLVDSVANYVVKHSEIPVLIIPS